MIVRPDPGEVARFTLTLPRPGDRCEIAIGRRVLDTLPDLLAAHAPAPRYIVVADETVAGLHGERVVDGLRGAGLNAGLVTIAPGEPNKTLGAWAALVEELGHRELGRDGCVIALGGGVTGDLAGFAAAAYSRGVALVQVPTTLLAMIDASIGGKTGVDLRAGKNLAGAFHQPRLIAIDPGVLETLPPQELRTGLAEAVKHGAISDPSYLEWLVVAGDRILALEPGAVDRLIAGSVRVKTVVVARDALESGERAILNFGHTIGHAIERVTDYRIPHGHAVAMGMVAEARIGERACLTDAGTADALADALRALDLPVALATGPDPRTLLDAARTDKKARAGAVRYSLIRRPGEPARGSDGAWTHAIDDDVAEAALEDG